MAVLSPLAARVIRTARNFTLLQWLACVAIGVGASAVATTLFTASFRVGDATTPLLLQKLQPLIAISAASMILGERLMPRFALFLLGGMAGAWLIAFPDPTDVAVGSATAAGLAVAAAALWGLGTVLGRWLSPSAGFLELTALRFAVGLPATAVVVMLDAGRSGFAVAAADIPALGLLALVPGLMGLTLYYRGLRHTSASAATLAELAFPLSAVLLGWLVLRSTLTPLQWVGTFVLSTTIVAMGLFGRSRNGVGVRLATNRHCDAPVEAGAPP